MKFTKVDTGVYEFWVKGTIYTAARNVAGFAHRDWDLYLGDRIVVDQLATRAECVEAARKRVALDRAAFDAAMKASFDAAVKAAAKG